MKYNILSKSMFLLGFIFLQGCGDPNDIDQDTDLQKTLAHTLSHKEDFRKNLIETLSSSEEPVPLMNFVSSLQGSVPSNLEILLKEYPNPDKLVVQVPHEEHRRLLREQPDRSVLILRDHYDDNELRAIDENGQYHLVSLDSPTKEPLLVIKEKIEPVQTSNLTIPLEKDVTQKLGLHANIQGRTVVSGYPEDTAQKIQVLEFKDYKTGPNWLRKEPLSIYAVVSYIGRDYNPVLEIINLDELGRGESPRYQLNKIIHYWSHNQYTFFDLAFMEKHTNWTVGDIAPVMTTMMQDVIAPLLAPGYNLAVSLGAKGLGAFVEVLTKKKAKDRLIDTFNTFEKIDPNAKTRFDTRALMGTLGRVYLETSLYSLNVAHDQRPPARPSIASGDYTPPPPSSPNPFNPPKIQHDSDSNTNPNDKPHQ